MMNENTMHNSAHLIVGLTGGIGSGKTTVSDMFAALGAKIIDADLIAREIVAPGTEALKAITERYGEKILLPDGQLNRAMLRGIIFKSDQDKAWLNQLTHPLIRQNIEFAITEPCDTYVILVAPLLMENQLDKLVNRVLVVDTTEEQQVARTANRDQREEGEVKAIIASQISRSERLSKADDIIDNSVASRDAVHATVKKLHEKYLLMSN